VPLLHARKSVDAVNRQRVSATHDILDGNSVVTEARDEAVMFGGLAGAAGCEREETDYEWSHRRTFHHRRAVRKTNQADGCKEWVRR
jgi:hypothetical protein